MNINDKSVIEAIEELAIVCMMNGMQPPKVIGFDKESLAKFSLSLKPKQKITVIKPLDQDDTIEQIYTTAGEIRLEEIE